MRWCAAFGARAFSLIADPGLAPWLLSAAPSGRRLTRLSEVSTAPLRSRLVGRLEVPAKQRAATARERLLLHELFAP